MQPDDIKEAGIGNKREEIKKMNKISFTPQGLVSIQTLTAVCEVSIFSPCDSVTFYPVFSHIRDVIIN